MVDERLLRALAEELPLEPRPFARLAERVGMGEEELLEGLRELQRRGAIRRLAAFFDERALGMDEGALVAWAVPPERLEAVAGQLARLPQISHCIERPPRPGWPYNLYTMVHASSRQECLAVIQEARRRCGVEQVAVFPTRRRIRRSSLAEELGRLLGISPGAVENPGESGGSEGR